MPAPDEFDRIMNKEFTVETPLEYTDPHPYGTPAQPVKTGLTNRGKAALGIGAAVLAGGSLIGYQAYSASTAASEAKTQEIAYKQQALELEKLREVNRANETQQNTQTSEEKARQASVDACVKDHSDQVGKDFGSPSYRDVVDACQAQYTPATNTTGMETAASTTTTGDTSSGGANDGVLIGGAALALFVVAAARKGTRSNQV